MVASRCAPVSLVHFSAGWCLQPVLKVSQGHCCFGPVLNVGVCTGRISARYQGPRTNVQFSSSDKAILYILMVKNYIFRLHTAKSRRRSMEVKVGGDRIEVAGQM